MGYHSFMGYGLKVPAYQVAGPVELRGYGLPPMVKRGPIYMTEVNLVNLMLVISRGIRYLPLQLYHIRAAPLPSIVVS